MEHLVVLFFWYDDSENLIERKEQRIGFACGMIFKAQITIQNVI